GLRVIFTDFAGPVWLGGWLKGVVMRVVILWLVATLFLGAAVASAEPTALLVDEFDARQAELWQDTNSPDDWSVSKGVLCRTGSDDSRFTARLSPQSDISVETRV